MQRLAAAVLGPLLLLLPLAAAAGGSATLKSGGGTLIDISWADSHTLRLENRDSPSYFLVRDGKAYAVTRQGQRTVVMDMGTMMKMMGGQRAAGRDRPAFGEIGAIEATGASETVAGVKGSVYRLSWTDHEGRRHSGEAVLTDDPLVVEMTDAYLSSVQAMYGSGATAFQNGLPDGKRGLLRSGSDLRLQSISGEAPPAGDFELPAKPVDLQQLLHGKEH